MLLLKLRMVSHLIMFCVQSHKESKENSIRMMKELNTVLAVRNVEKQRKREVRERKKHGGLLQPRIPPGNLSQLPPINQKVLNNQELQKTVATGTSIQEPFMAKEAAAEHQSANRNFDKILESSTASELSSKEAGKGLGHKFHEGELHFMNRLSGDSSAFSSSAIAQAAAAFALTSGRAKREEMFHDDQDSCSTPSEDEADKS